MIKIFQYIEELDCFIVDPVYKALAYNLGLTEWNEVVWIGRYFLMDNDFGEHWFDNWELRDLKEKRAEEMGLDTSDLLIIDAARFTNELDGPCHSPEARLLFWKDVLTSLKLSLDLLFAEARSMNEERKKLIPEEYITDLEERIKIIKQDFS